MLKLRHGILAVAFVISFLILLVSQLPGQGAKEVKTEELLQEIGLLSQELQGFRVDGHISDEESTKLTLRSSRDVLRIEAISGIDKKSADALIEDEIITIRALYGAALSPYPGQISNQIVCNKKFMPVFGKKENELNYSYFVLFATERLTYGACSEDLVRYKAILAWTYCLERSSFYRIQLFSPLDSELLEDLATSFRCTAT